MKYRGPQRLISSCAAMSALGQKQTFRRVGVMSALPPKADIQRLSQCARNGLGNEMGHSRPIVQLSKMHSARLLPPSHHVPSPELNFQAGAQENADPANDS